MSATLEVPTARRLSSGRRPVASPAGKLKRYVMPWLFLAPALVLFIVFKFIPMIDAIRMSFYDVQPYLGDEWVGGENYAAVFSDSSFLDAIGNTVILAVGTTAGSMLIGMVLALLLEGTAKNLWVIRTAVFIPAVAAMAVVAEIWRVLMYPAASGPMNSLIGLFGFGPSEFLNSADSSMISVLIVGIWKSAPYDMMIILAGLAGVDRTLYEAAALDGAGPLRRVWSVTFPQLKGVLSILITLAAIRGLRVFTEVFLLTNGGPNGATEVLMTLIYKLGLERGELGIASAGSVVLLVATVVLTVLVRAAGRKKKGAS